MPPFPLPTIPPEAMALLPERGLARLLHPVTPEAMPTFLGGTGPAHVIEAMRVDLAAMAAVLDRDRKAALARGDRATARECAGQLRRLAGTAEAISASLTPAKL